MGRTLNVNTSGGFMTTGKNIRKHEFNPAIPMNKREEEIAHFLSAIFKAKARDTDPPVVCWYDELDGVGTHGDPDYEGSFYFGALFSDRGRLTHFFVRKLTNFTGPLDLWNEGILVPQGTAEFGGFIVVPESNVIRNEVSTKVRNVMVPSYHWRQLEQLGHNLDLILEEVSDEKYRWDPSVEETTEGY